MLFYFNKQYGNEIYRKENFNKKTTLLTHEKYEEIHQQKVAVVQVHTKNLAKLNNRIFLTAQLKRALCKYDNKRMWEILLKALVMVTQKL